jgi:hypothetical protein
MPSTRIESQTAYLLVTLHIRIGRIRSDWQPAAGGGVWVERVEPTLKVARHELR